MTVPKWLEWAQRLQAIAQSGLAYNGNNPFEIERYEAVRAIAAEILSQHSDLPPDQARALFSQDKGYATPKVDVRGVVIHEGGILLVKERKDAKWTLPGGWVDVGESPGEAAVRETFEESGYLTRAVKLLALYDRNKHPHPPAPFHIYKIFVLCELTGGSPAISAETDGVGFFAEDKIPELSLPRVTPQQIARFFEHARHPDWPTDLD